MSPTYTADCNLIFLYLLHLGKACVSLPASNVSAADFEGGGAGCLSSGKQELQPALF